MTTRKQVMDAIKKLGCTVDEMECDPDMLTIDAPKGKLFACTGSHCLCEPLVDHFNTKLTRSDAYRAILSDLSHGFEDCTDPECDCRCSISCDGHCGFEGCFRVRHHDWRTRIDAFRTVRNSLGEPKDSNHRNAQVV